MKVGIQLPWGDYFSPIVSGIHPALRGIGTIDAGLDLPMVPCQGVLAKGPRHKLQSRSRPIAGAAWPLGVSLPASIA